MKRHISDMMDSMADVSLELNQQTPLSSQRIKELTMNKITEKRRSRRTGFRVLAAAAVIVALTATVFAAGTIADWFDDYLANSRFVPESWSDASVMEDYTMELLAEPVSGIPAYQFDGDGVIDITVVSIRLRPDSLMYFYHATDLGSTFDHYPGEVKVAMLDGTEIVLIPSGFGRVSDEPDSLDWVEYAADVPPVDEIDYIELPGGTKITVP